MFRKAERKQAKLKIGFSAPSGAGKTYSALLVAYGLCGDWNKVAVIDTENNSAELYSDLGEYSVCPIAPPYTPTKYIDAIREAVNLGFEVLIIDSLSHAWSGEGGLLEMKDKVVSKNKNSNSFNAWREISPEHNRLVNAMLQSNIDVIVTTRAKSDYVISKDDNGKTKVDKVGLSPVFREGLEFELTAFFDLSQDHIATASKDRTRLFDGAGFIPTVETGKLLAEWRNSGAAIILATQEQKDTLIALGSQIEAVAQYFHVDADSLTYEQAQWAIDEKKRVKQKKQPPAPTPPPKTDIKYTPPEELQPPPNVSQQTATREEQIAQLTKGTSITMVQVGELIVSKFGKPMALSDLSKEQFTTLLSALSTMVAKELDNG